MGTYDTLHDGDRFEQLKLWGKGLRHLHVGDVVGLPRGGLAPDGTYTVVMRTGGFVHVADGVIVGWREEAGAGPQLTTRGLRYSAADWPGGPFGPWYRYADLPASRRPEHSAEEPCPGARSPALRVVRSGDPASDRDRALAAAQGDVADRLAADPDQTERIAAARDFLADRTGYVDVACEAAAGLLGMGKAPDRAGERLVALLSSAGAEAPEWSNAAALVTRYATELPAAVVADCLSRLADALPAEEPPVPADEFRASLSHPAIRRRRARALDLDDFLDRLGRYGERDFLAAAEAAVARHGAAVLPAVPLRFWARDIVVAELAAPLLEPVLGRPFTDDEFAALPDALSDVAGSLASLERSALKAAMAPD
jgi:hypothetical protein